MRYLILASFLIALPTLGQPATTPAPARQPPWPIAVPVKAFKAHGQGGYLDAILSLDERRADIESEQERDLFLDFYATHLSLANEYERLVKVNDELWARSGSNTRAITLEEGYKPVDAVAHILKAAETHQIVMFNEEHRSSIQRAFMSRILAGLRERGFTHLCIEAVEEGQAEGLNTRGYATLSTGLYTRDPSFGDFIRQASALSFVLVNYDGFGERKPGMSTEEVTNSREALQARNILERTIAKDPKAKVVVYGGRHHISEHQPKEGWTPMGGILKKLSGVDPLTVDLMMMVESGNPKAQVSAYTDAAAKGWLDADPIVLVNDQGDSLRGLYKAMLDIVVFHPRTTWIQGRPHWMQMGGQRTPRRIDVDPSLTANPVLLQAFVKGENDDAVPVDHVVLWPGKPQPALMLRKGDYRVQAVDRTGKVLVDSSLTVE